MSQFQLLLSQPTSEILVFGMSGEIDLGSVRPLEEAARTASKNDYRALVFDLTQVDFMDSTGINVLVEADRAMAAKGKEVKVVCSSENLLRIFEITALTNVLTIVPSREEALASYAVAG